MVLEIFHDCKNLTNIVLYEKADSIRTSALTVIARIEATTSALRINSDVLRVESSNSSQRGRHITSAL